MQCCTLDLVVKGDEPVDSMAVTDWWIKPLYIIIQLNIANIILSNDIVLIPR